MKLNVLLLGAMLAAMATAPARAEKTPTWKMNNQLTMGEFQGRCLQFCINHNLFIFE